MEAVGSRVAVVGLGAIGLVAVKNLLEEGFDVTGFDSNAYVGGLWRFSEEDKTSVLASTVVNICKEVNCFTDFPFPRDVPSHCTAAQVADYMESYADHFNLRPHLRLSTNVTKIKRDAENSKWVLEIEGSETLAFDRVVVATGMNSATHTPSVPGMDRFAGDKVHSRAFKKPEQFAGKRVVVVGLSYTGADTIDALRGVAKEIYISHKHGAIVAPREIDGKSLGYEMSLRKLAFASFLESHLPSVHEKMMNVFLAKLQNKCFTIQPEWRLSPAPSIKHALPIVSDTLIDNFAAGHVTSIPGIAAIVDAHTLQLDDGSKLEADAIIWCTGYRSDFSILDASGDPTRRTADRWAKAAGSRGKPLPRLYQNVLSEDYPESLSFLGHVAYSTGAFVLYDLASMAVTQIWKGNSPLPVPKQITAQIDAHHAWITSIAEDGPVVPAWVKRGEWLDWVDEVAGTGIREHLGWGGAGWAYWWNDAEMQKMLMDGICSPHAYRLFDGKGKRKAWEGAREEILRVNEEAQAQSKTGK